MGKKVIDRSNPALSFISQASTEPEPSEPQERKHKEAIPEGYKLNPYLIEKKSRRLQLLIKPSLYEKVKERATEAGTSINDYINTTLENVTQNEAEEQ